MLGRPDERTRSANSRAGVNADHSALADKKAGVVDPPGPIRLDVGEDAVVDLVQLGRGRGGDVVVDGARVALRCGEALLSVDVCIFADPAGLPLVALNQFLADDCGITDIAEYARRAVDSTPREIGQGPPRQVPRRALHASHSRYTESPYKVCGARLPAHGRNRAAAVAMTR
jgi:hypothetical protein